MVQNALIGLYPQPFWSISLCNLRWSLNWNMLIVFNRFVWILQGYVVTVTFFSASSKWEINISNANLFRNKPKILVYPFHQRTIKKSKHKNHIHTCHYAKDCTDFSIHQKVALAIVFRHPLPSFSMISATYLTYQSETIYCLPPTESE